MRNKFNDNLTGNKIASGNNTIKAKGDIINNYHNQNIKMTKNDKLEFAEKVAQTKYEANKLEREIFGCPICKDKIRNQIHQVRQIYRNKGIICVVDDTYMLLNGDVDLDILCDACKEKIELLREKRYLIETFNQMLNKK